MTHRWPTYLLLAALLAGAGLARGADGPVRLTADQVEYDQARDVLRAEGDVQASWGGATLTARRIAYLRGQNRLDASGEVHLKRDGDWFRGDEATFEVESDRGTIEQPRLFLQSPNLYLAGTRLERGSAVDYQVAEGSFTTCDGTDPSWRIGASEINVTLEEFASARHAVFYLAKVPVFYFPYLIFPIKTERQSGLLLPTIGNSTKKGFSYSQPFYWAISPSADATVALDIQTRRGVGGGAELRYLRPNQSSGQFDGFAIYDREQSRTRGNLHLGLREEFPAGFTLRSDVSQVTDRDYFRDFTVESGDYNREYLESVAGLDWQGERSLVGLEARAWRNLDPTRPDEPLQRLPAVKGRIVSTPIGVLPVHLGLSGTAVRFQRPRGVQGERAVLEPTLLVTPPVIPGVTLTAGGGYQLRGYRPDRSGQGDENRGIGLAMAEAELNSTLERTYATGWSALPRLRHLLLPSAGYRYLQSRDQERLPFFDWDDRVPGGQELNWSLTNLVQGTFMGSDGGREWRDLLSLRLSQAVLLAGERRDLLAPADRGDLVGDLRLELLATPVKELSIWLDSRYNPNRAVLSSTYLAADYRDLRDNLLGIGYFAADDRFSYLEGKVATSLLRPLVAEYRARYSLDRPGFLESFYGLEYRHQCWGVSVSYSDRPDNREVMVSFSLGGIGSLGKLKVF